MIDGLSIKIKNYACFGEEPQGFDSVKRINILIGKNNSGKSRLIDLIEFLDLNKHLLAETEIIIGYPFTVFLSDPDLKNEISNSQITRRDGPFSTTYRADEFIKDVLDTRDLFISRTNTNIQFINIDPPIESNKYTIKSLPVDEFFKGLIQRRNSKSFPNLNDKIIKVIRAERDVKTEQLQKNNLTIDSSGKGATNILRRYLDDRKLQKSVVSELLLEKLNEIVAPEMLFNDIDVRSDYSNDDLPGEIYLYDPNKKEPIPLSASGSGLKTILLVLIYTELLPMLESIDESNFIFAFEELENNLHPSLQRKLYKYIRNLAETKKATFFITTHSSIAIDQFINDPLAQIYRIEHNGKNALSTPINTYAEGGSVLDDLGVRASDVLQSNGVIWVEGPSDRIYINKWIELWSGGKIREYVHYQCLFYGGETLSYLSADESETSNDLIKILSLNSNAYVVMDSDKEREDEPIRGTKKRIFDQLSEDNCWITQGRTIENYLPKSAIIDATGAEIHSEVGIFEPFKEYLNKAKPKMGNGFKKVQFSKTIREKLTKENCNRLDLDEQMNKLVDEIKKWNSLD